MERGTTAWTRISGNLAGAIRGVSRSAALLIVGLLAGGLLSVICVAPAPVGFVLTTGLAAAWCAWLASHPEAPQGTDRSPEGVPSGQTGATSAVAVLATPAVIGAALCVIAATAVAGQTVPDSAAPPASAAPEQAASTEGFGNMSSAW
jgi:hypothetical protein